MGTIWTNGLLLEKSNRNLEEFEFVHHLDDKNAKLGFGSFATVKLAKDKKNNKLYAIKLIDIRSTKSGTSDINNLSTEISIHSKLVHPNIIKYYDYFQHGDIIHMILEYADNGNLYSYMHKTKGINEIECFKYFYQTCLAIQYMHQNNFMHRDVKPENLLLDKDYNIKLCDFGWAAQNIKHFRTTFCGTYEYMAPELINKQYYDYRVDIWSLGILLFELLHKEAPFKGRNVTQVKKSMENPVIRYGDLISTDAKDLISNILNFNMDERFSIDQILNHAWVKKHLKMENNHLKGEIFLSKSQQIQIDNGILGQTSNDIQILKGFNNNMDKSNPYIKKEISFNNQSNNVISINSTKPIIYDSVVQYLNNKEKKSDINLFSSTVRDHQLNNQTSNNIISKGDSSITIKDNQVLSKNSLNLFDQNRQNNRTKPNLSIFNSDLKLPQKKILYQNDMVLYRSDKAISSHLNVSNSNLDFDCDKSNICFGNSTKYNQISNSDDLNNNNFTIRKKTKALTNGSLNLDSLNGSMTDCYLNSFHSKAKSPMKKLNSLLIEHQYMSKKSQSYSDIHSTDSENKVNIQKIQRRIRQSDLLSHNISSQIPLFCREEVMNSSLNSFISSRKATYSNLYNDRDIRFMSRQIIPDRDNDMMRANAGFSSCSTLNDSYLMNKANNQRLQKNSQNLTEVDANRIWRLKSRTDYNPIKLIDYENRK